MNENIFERIKTFILKESAVDMDITRDTKIEDDLGIYGDDADDFIIAFGREFDVDIKHFPLGNYFSGEGDVILPSIIRFFTNGKKRERKNFTVGHLEKALISGKLDEHVINM